MEENKGHAQEMAHGNTAETLVRLEKKIDACYAAVGRQNEILTGLCKALGRLKVTGNIILDFSEVFAVPESGTVAKEDIPASDQAMPESQETDIDEKKEERQLKTAVDQAVSVGGTPSKAVAADQNSAMHKGHGDGKVQKQRHDADTGVKDTAEGDGPTRKLTREERDGNRPGGGTSGWRHEVFLQDGQNMQAVQQEGRAALPKAQGAGKAKTDAGLKPEVARLAGLIKDKGWNLTGVTDQEVSFTSGRRRCSVVISDVLWKLVIRVYRKDSEALRKSVRLLSRQQSIWLFVVNGREDTQGSLLNCEVQALCHIEANSNAPQIAVQLMDEAIKCYFLDQ